MDNLDNIKEFLRQEPTLPGMYEDVSMLPILHNENEVILLFSGWSINLFRDGSWFWEATDGG